MALNLSTNTAARRAGAELSRNNKLLQRSINRLATGRKIVSPVDDPGSLAVSMKLSASINRLAGARNNTQNAISYMEVQDGLLDTVGNIVSRMSELKGFASQDPMKGEQDVSSYDNEFKDLQLQLYDISQMTFNGVSLFANYVTAKGSTETLFNAQNQNLDRDNTLSIFTSANGNSGSKVSINKSLLASALTLRTDGSLAGTDDGTNAAWSIVESANKSSITVTSDRWITLVNKSQSTTMSLDQVSTGIFVKAMENISYLRAQNGGSQSRLNFSVQSLAQQKMNLHAALGRMVDSDLAEESTNLNKYSILSHASASMLAQANASTDIALLLIR